MGFNRGFTIVVVADRSRGTAGGGAWIFKGAIPDVNGTGWVCYIVSVSDPPTVVKLGFNPDTTSLSN
jgi:hypothetical protein